MKPSTTKFYLYAYMIIFCNIIQQTIYAQALRIPDDTNFSNTIGRRVGALHIDIKYNAPGVKGREGRIWGTNVVPYGFTVLGFGSDMASPWRAGADECTTIEFNHDVTVNGKNLKAGKYAFFIAVYRDSCTLIFNSNTNAWGSYFYDASKDVLHVTAKQEKGIPALVERLEYKFLNQQANSIDVALEWEHWRIPFTVGIDNRAAILSSIQSQMTGAIGFDPPSLAAAAQWCLTNNVNLDQALHWVNSAIDPSLGGQNSFTNLNIKSSILSKQGKVKQSEEILATAMDNATSIELHTYGRQLLQQGQTDKAIVVFEKNYSKFKGAWPTPVGMMRAYSAKGDYVKALKYAKEALPIAPAGINKTTIEENIKLLENGKPVK